MTKFLVVDIPYGTFHLRYRWLAPEELLAEFGNARVGEIFASDRAFWLEDWVYLTSVGRECRLIGKQDILIIRTN